jgi:transposase-like protein
VHRNGHRERRLDTTFGPLVLAVPRARLADDNAGEREWKGALLPAYRSLSRRAELLIAEVYLAGVNTRRVRRALQTLCAAEIFHHFPRHDRRGGADRDINYRMCR